MGETAPRAPLLFALELVILYAAGSYAIGHLMWISGFGGGGVLRRLVFYLLVFPGVVLHESAHYLACLLTGTKVVRFAPFSPQTSADDRLMLGYVRHEHRSFPIRAVIGIAPVLLNPLGLLLVTALLTPLTFQQVVDPSIKIVVKEILANGFLAANPLLAAIWAYMCLSFALGGVPSQEDLSSLPPMVVVFGGGILLGGLLRIGSESVLFSAIIDLFTLAARLYALPAAVAVVSGLVIMIWRRMN